MCSRAARLAAIFLFCAAGLSATADDSAPLPTDADCVRFGHQLEDEVNGGLPGLVVDAIDTAALGERVVRPLALQPQEKSDFLNGFAKGTRSTLSKESQAWKRAHFVHVSTVDGEKRVLLRLQSANGSVNYLDWVCASIPDGGVKIVDCYSYLSGELMSRTSRNALLPALAEKDRTFLDHLAGVESAYVASLPKLAVANNDLLGGDAKTALAILEALPPEVKAMPVVRLCRLRAAQIADQTAYARIIAEWEKAAPNDPALDMISIDGCILRKDYPGCIQHLLALQRRIGPDGYLEYLRGAVLQRIPDLEGARAALRHAIAIEPDLAAPYDLLFGIELQAKEWARLADELALFDRNFPNGDIWLVIQKMPNWSGFRQSKACARWLETRAAARQPHPPGTP